MPLTFLQHAALIGVLLIGASSRAEPVRVAFEVGIDQEVAAVLSGNGGELLVLQRSFLEPRKARMDPARAANDIVQLWDVRTGATSAVFSYKADAPLWISAARPASNGVAFAARGGSSAAALYTVAGRERTVSRVVNPWERKSGEAKARDYERLFPTTDGVIGVYADVGVYRAELWAGDAAVPVPLDTFIENGDGRIIAIDDVAEIDGRVTLLLTVASGRGVDLAEFWLLSFDRTFKRVAARAVRLETGTVASGKASFVRRGQVAAAVRVTQRGSTYARPSLKLFPLTGGVAFWSRELPRLVGADDVALVGVCRGSFLMLSGNHDERGRTTVAEWLLIGPAGQEHTLERQTMPEGTLLTRMLAASDKERVWSYLNFTRFESTRRSDGWYSWRGFQVNAEPQTRHCRFE
jgi:hypothetical protein